MKESKIKNFSQSKIENRKSKIRIGIIGGTFNPIHYGHLLAAEEARQRFDLHEVIFVPCARPPHKNQPDIAGPEDRYKMTCLAISSNKYFKASDIEIKRGGVSYSEDTLREFKKIYGEEAELYFIIGADASAELDTWKNVEKLPQLCQFIAVNRPGYNLKPTNFTHILEIPDVDISSTVIRARIKQGKSIKYLLPEEVENYIYEQKLYGIASR